MNDEVERIASTPVDYSKARSTSGEVIEKRAGRIDDDTRAHLEALRKLVESKADNDTIKKSEHYEKCKRVLTPMQQKFQDGLLKGKTLVEAYRAAYGCDQSRSDASIHSDAWKLSQHPLIVLNMRIAYEKARERSVMSAHRIREHVLTRLMKESDDQANPAQARIRALELLGKVAEVGMFVNRSEVRHTTNDPDEMKRELMNKLRDFFRVGVDSEAEDATLIEDKTDTKQS